MNLETNYSEPRYIAGILKKLSVHRILLSLSLTTIVNKSQHEREQGMNAGSEKLSKENTSKFGQHSEYITHVFNTD